MTISEAKHICRIDYISGFFVSLRETYADLKENLGEERAKQGYEKCIAELVEQYMAARREEYLDRRTFTSLLAAIRDWEEANRAVLFASEKTSTNEYLLGGITNRGSVDFEKTYKVGYLITPSNLDAMPFLASGHTFVAPNTVDLRDYCVGTRDQARNPWCAAYSATGFASNILWRKTDIPQHFDPAPIYAEAKKIDGMPHADGTSLTAALEVLLKNKIFNSEFCSIKTLRNVQHIKYAIHKFGCCLLGLNVSKEWYTCNPNKATISGKKDREQCGGHAVLACGYTKDGVIIQNSWGSDWGCYGFALITWAELEREFMYGAVIDNCLYDTKMN